MLTKKTKKILITILSLTLLFLYGCDNENKTGGGGAEGGTGTKERRTIRVTSRTTQEPAIIFFKNHYPEIGNITSVEVSIVTAAAGVNNPFSPIDFNYDIVTGELALTDSGLKDINNATWGFEKGVEYEYGLKLEFNDDADNTKDYDIIIIKDY